MNLREKLKHLLYLIKQNIHLINLIISVLCLIFLGIHILLINLNIEFVSLGYNILILVIGLYVIMFLPSYPIFFLILKRDTFTTLSKVSLTIIVNISFYIVSGYFGFWLGFNLTNVFFYFILIVSYSICFISVLIRLVQKGNLPKIFSDANSSDKREFSNTFSVLRFLRQKVSINVILLIVFIFLLCGLNIIATNTFSGSDPWLHIAIIKVITSMNYLPLENYYGCLGLHIFGSLLYFFSGVEAIIIPSLYIFMSIPLSSLILYVFFQSVFSNKNIIILGTFMAEFTSLGFGGIMQVFWPESIAILQCLMIFYLLYRRISKFNGMKDFEFKKTLPGMLFTYITIILLFLGAFFTHSLVTMIMVITFLWVYLIYFLKDYRRGIDFLLLCLLVGFFVIFYQLNIATGHFSIISQFTHLPFYYYILIVIVLIVGLSPIIRSLVKNIRFGQKELLKLDFDLIQKYQRRETKIILPFAIGIVTFLSVLFFIGNLLVFNFEVYTIFSFIEIITISFFSLWGIIIFQKSTRGKVFYIWLIGFSFIMLFGLVYDLIITVQSLWLRVFHISSPVLLIGFLSYIYKLIKIKVFRKRKFQIFLVTLILFSLVTSIYEISQYYGDSSFYEREIELSEWYGKYTSDKNLLICKFGLRHPFLYHTYPYKEGNKSLEIADILMGENLEDYYAIPEKHIKDGKNLLKQLKNESNTDVYLLLSSIYLTVGDWKIYGNLDQEIYRSFYNLTYLNRVCSSKSSTQQDEPLYWVI